MSLWPHLVSLKLQHPDHWHRSTVLVCYSRGLVWAVWLVTSQGKHGFCFVICLAEVFIGTLRGISCIFVDFRDKKKVPFSMLEMNDLQKTKNESSKVRGSKIVLRRSLWHSFQGEMDKPVKNALWKTGRKYGTLLTLRLKGYSLNELILNQRLRTEWRSHP